ncbi:hypothetical protein BGW37DRAFT_502865 [Umbelopsis sp. PMI_123]|nr:hypothetical protein BGW37DRAFT_502865 [Umbelopsis sp. PMI_123]
MIDKSAFVQCGSRRIMAIVVVLLALTPMSFAQTWVPNPYAIPEGNTIEIDSSPVQATREDWMILIARVATQYVLWWLTDLILIVLWQRQPVKAWLRHSIRKIFFQWRPGPVFIISCQPSEASEALRFIDGSDNPQDCFLCSSPSLLIAGHLRLEDYQYIRNG